MLKIDSPRRHIGFVFSPGWREMISLSLVSIFLLGSSLTRVTAEGLTGTSVRVTPVDGTHLSFDYKQSVNIEDYSQLEKVIIDIDVSIIRKIPNTFC